MVEQEIRFSVVVPVYGNRDSLAEVVARLIEMSRDRHGRLEAVFVVDGSPDDSLLVLERELADGRLPAQVLDLTRNFGSFSAVRMGLESARGEFVAVMAADLQEPPEAVAEFFDRLEAGDCDVVIGRRIGRDDPALSSLSAQIYWRFYRRFVNPDIPAGGVDVFACTSQVGKQIAEFRESHTSLVGLIFWVGYRREFVDYERSERHSGKSGWTGRRKLRYLLDSIYAFTDLPLIILQVVGGVGIVGSVLLGIAVFIAWLVRAITLPGYAPLMLVLLFATSAILLALGVVGSYVWRAYENGKGRPIALVRNKTYLGEDQ